MNSRQIFDQACKAIDEAGHKLDKKFYFDLARHLNDAPFVEAAVCWAKKTAIRVFLDEIPIELLQKNDDDTLDWIVNRVINEVGIV